MPRTSSELISNTIVEEGIYGLTTSPTYISAARQEETFYESIVRRARIDAEERRLMQESLNRQELDRIRDNAMYGDMQEHEEDLSYIGVGDSISDDNFVRCLNPNCDLCESRRSKTFKLKKQLIGICKIPKKIISTTSSVAVRTFVPVVNKGKYVTHRSMDILTKDKRTRLDVMVSMLKGEIYIASVDYVKTQDGEKWSDSLSMRYNL